MWQIDSGEANSTALVAGGEFKGIHERFLVQFSVSRENF